MLEEMDTEEQFKDISPNIEKGSVRGDTKLGLLLRKMKDRNEKLTE